MEDTIINWPDGKTYLLQPPTRPLVLGPLREDGSRFVHRGKCHRGENEDRTELPEEILGTLLDGEISRIKQGKRRNVHFCVQVMKQ